MIGLIDTGASVVCINKRIVRTLGLRAVDQDVVLVPGGQLLDATIYLARLEIPELGFSELTPLYAANMGRGGYQMLLGRSLLRHFITTFDGPAGMFHVHRPRSAPEREADDDYAT